VWCVCVCGVCVCGVWGVCVCVCGGGARVVWFFLQGRSKSQSIQHCLILNGLQVNKEVGK
jgi:hypothetical protein